MSVIAYADLFAFIRARLDEDEAVAWEVHTANEADADLEIRAEGERLADDALADWDVCLRDGNDGRPTIAVGVARLVTDVQSKRAILDVMEDRARTVAGDRAYGYPLPQHADSLVAAAVLKHLATPYQDHPDYRKEWR